MPLALGMTVREEVALGTALAAPALLLKTKTTKGKTTTGLQAD